MTSLLRDLYLLGVTSGITYAISHNYAKIQYLLSQFLIKIEITATIIYT